MITKHELEWATILALTAVSNNIGPSGIRIIESPHTVLYHNGDDIDFEGISVAAFVGDKRWDVPRYPNGVIPYNELVFPQKRVKLDAPLDQEIWTDGYIYALKFDSNELGYIGEVGENTWFLSDEVVFSYFITQYYGVLYAAQVSDIHPPIRWHYCEKQDHTGQMGFSDNSISWNRMEFVTFASVFFDSFPLNAIPTSTVDPLGRSATQLAVPLMVPVQWRGFEARFEIMVKP